MYRQVTRPYKTKWIKGIRDTGSYFGIGPISVGRPPETPVVIWVQVRSLLVDRGFGEPVFDAIMRYFDVASISNRSLSFFFSLSLALSLSRTRDLFNLFHSIYTVLSMSSSNFNPRPAGTRSRQVTSPQKSMNARHSYTE